MSTQTRRLWLKFSEAKLKRECPTKRRQTQAQRRMMLWTWCLLKDSSRVALQYVGANKDHPRMLCAAEFECHQHSQTFQHLDSCPHLNPTPTPHPVFLPLSRFQPLSILPLTRFQHPLFLLLARCQPPPLQRLQFLKHAIKESEPKLQQHRGG